MKPIIPALGVFAALLGQTPEAIATDRVIPPPPWIVTEFKLATNYTKCLIVEGLPVVGSARVSDFGLMEAAFLIRKQIGHRPEVLRAMASNNVRFVIMAPTEMTTDVPEHSDLTPKGYWNRRARGLGATKARPAVSCGEENLLCLKDDPYWKENILIHEFGHAIHERGMSTVDPTFDKRLQAAFDHAKSNGLWKGTYAMQNRMEYWAEGTQSWFDTNRSNDHDHGEIDTRDELKAYDPDFAKLLEEVYGDFPWRYQRPAKRPESERTHLAGFDPGDYPAFAWPKEAPKMDQQGRALAWLAPEKMPAASPRGSNPGTTILFLNQRPEAVSIEWLDFDGHRKHVADVRPRVQHLLNTYATHIFVVTENGRALGAVVATEDEGRVEIR